MAVWVPGAFAAAHHGRKAPAIYVATILRDEACAHCICMSVVLLSPQAGTQLQISVHPCLCSCCQCALHPTDSCMMPCSDFATSRLLYESEVS